MRHTSGNKTLGFARSNITRFQDFRGGGRLPELFGARRLIYFARRKCDGHVKLRDQLSVVHVMCLNSACHEILFIIYGYQ